MTTRVAQLLLLSLLALPSGCDKPTLAEATPLRGREFAIPTSIVVSVAPYDGVQAALDDLKNIDWDRDTDRARAITLAWAANELKTHLESAGLMLEVRSPLDGIPSSAIVLSVLDENCGSVGMVGRSQYSVSNCHDLGGQGYSIAPVRGRLQVSGTTTVAVLYGVYALLEELGFAWDDPFETLAPSTDELTRVRTWRKIRRTPVLRHRGFWIYGDETVPDEFAIWMARNRLNVGGRPARHFHRLLGIKSWAGEHNLLQEEFSRPGLFEAHPEWFAEINGIRRPIPPTGIYFNPSFASREAAEYFARRMVERLESGDLQDVDILNIWPADDRFSRFDTSAAALAVGNPSDNLLLFFVNVARCFREARADGRLSRKVTLAGISYFLTMEPPTNAEVIDDLEDEDYIHLFYPIDRDWNGRIDIGLSDRASNRRILDDMRQWRQKCAFDAGVVEYHNQSVFAGIALTDHLSLVANETILTRDNRALYAYMHPLLRNPGPRRLTNALQAKVAWSDEGELDPTAAIAVTSGYFERRYGAGAAEWRAIYDLLAKSCENSKEMFGINSLSWLLLQEQIWGDRFYSEAETAQLIERYRRGGSQDLPTAFSGGISERATFRGLDESLALQAEARTKWTAVVSGALDRNVRRRMESDVVWFETTASRYNLLLAAIHVFEARHAGEDDRAARERMLEEIALLSSASTTDDTVSPVDQRAFLDPYRKFAGTTGMK